MQDEMLKEAEPPRGFSHNHIIKLGDCWMILYPSDLRLSYERKDGQPLTEEDKEKLTHFSLASCPELKGRVYSNRREAEKAIREILNLTFFSGVRKIHLPTLLKLMGWFSVGLFLFAVAFNTEVSIRIHWSNIIPSFLGGLIGVSGGWLFAAVFFLIFGLLVALIYEYIFMPVKRHFFSFNKMDNKSKDGET